jgi:hypothetical protein
MTDLIGTYQLYSPADDCDCEIQVFDEVDATHVGFINREWMPILKSQRQLAAIRFKQLGKSTNDEWQHLLGEYGAPDSHWNWDNLAKPGVVRTTHRSFSVLTGDEVEAVMVVDLTQRCEIGEQNGEHLVYVENLAVAPWNREEIQSPRRLGGLGKVMLALAVKLSESEGWKGRVGLHSLSQSESFYEKCNMTCVKNDPNYEDLWYFEFTPAQAKEFLS